MGFFSAISVVIWMTLIASIFSDILLQDPTRSQIADKRNCYVVLNTKAECLLCKRPSGLQIKIDDLVWKYEEMPISIGKNLISSHSGYHVTETAYSEIRIDLIKVSPQNIGNFTCYYKYKDKDYQEKEQEIVSYTVILRGKPEIVNHSNQTMTLYEGDTAEIWCNAISPVPNNIYETTWYTHFNKSDRPIGINGSKLQIENITRHCAAIYRCWVKNEEGSIHMDFNVTVRFKPELQIALKINEEEEIFTESTEVKIKPSSRISIICILNAFPDVDYVKWLKSDKLIGTWSHQTADIKTEKDFDKKYVVSKSQENGYHNVVLTFESEASADDDMTTFECSATNAIGTQSLKLTFV